MKSKVNKQRGQGHVEEKTKLKTKRTCKSRQRKKACKESSKVTKQGKGITRTVVIHGRMKGQGKIGGKVKGKAKKEANQGKKQGQGIKERWETRK